jgi:hypothetical protein
MSDVDDLAFDIAFALSQKPIGTEVRNLIASLPDEAVDHLSRVVAEHLLDRGWQRAAAAPGATADPHFW